VRTEELGGKGEQRTEAVLEKGVAVRAAEGDTRRTRGGRFRGAPRTAVYQEKRLERERESMHKNLQTTTQTCRDHAQ